MEEKSRKEEKFEENEHAAQVKGRVAPEQATVGQKAKRGGAEAPDFEVLELMNFVSGGAASAQHLGWLHGAGDTAGKDAAYR